MISRHRYTNDKVPIVVPYQNPFGRNGEWQIFYTQNGLPEPLEYLTLVNSYLLSSEETL